MSLNSTAQDHLSAAAIQNINRWLEEDKYAEYKNDLDKMIAKKQWEQLEDAFFKVIEFGTGGRRGTTGVGSNRINRVTIGESAQALCEYALSFDSVAGSKGIVIACDTRLTSPELSEYAASVCAATGFKTYIFDSFRSTPELSFAVRHLDCAAGIVISASHNPPADNGFKAYWRDGGQLVSPHDHGVLNRASAITKINTLDFGQAVKDGLITIIGKQVDDEYIKAVVNEAEGSERDVKIVYSPLHGAGQTNVLPALTAAGFKHISQVVEQMVPDGNFPTVSNGKPNPEEKSANDMAVNQMLEEEADIAITNDPDADRIGIVVRHGDSAFYLNGNQSASLAADYSLRKKADKGELTSKHYIAKTIVTTDLLTSIAHQYNVKIYEDFLVGFKYIGNLLLQKENTDEIFVLGGEESYGLLKGTYARDKDGATGALPLAEYAAELKSRGKTLRDRLFELYEEHGLYVERLDTLVCPGADGFEKMETIMRELRANPPSKIGEFNVSVVRDYSTLERKSIVDNNYVTPMDGTKGNVVVLEFGDKRRRITVRPSGTEPKIKFYVQWFDEIDQSISDSVEKQYNHSQKHLVQLSKLLEKALLP